jgi:HK97 family phage major capsid protein
MANLHTQYVAALDTEKSERDKFGTALAETTAAIAKMDARFDELETKLARPVSPANGANDGNEEAKAAMVAWLRKGEVTPEQAKALTRADDTTGGYFAEPDLVQEIIKGETNITPFRDMVRVKQTDKLAISIYKRTGQFAAVRVAEGATRSETTGLAWGRERMPLEALHALVLISVDDLEDSSFDLEAEVAMEAAEQLAVKEGAEFINGTGSNGQAEGVLTNPDIAYTNHGHASNLLYAGIMDFLHSFKPGYFNSPDFMLGFNLTTLGALRKVVGSDGHPIFAVDAAADAPATIAGKKYRVLPDMPDIASDAFPIIGGNFKRGYVWGDRRSMSIQRLVEKYADTGQVGIQVRARSGGQVVLPEAIKKLKMHT